MCGTSALQRQFSVANRYLGHSTVFGTGPAQIRGGERQDLLLREAPENLYAAALEKWPHLSLGVEEAAAILSV